MRRADRLFQLVFLLRRGPITTARNLARELQVSERTVYRDIQALSLSGVPVEGEAGVGYILRREFELPPLMFTGDEAKALVLGARIVQAWGDPALQQAARRVLDKVSAVTPPEVRETLGLVRHALDSSRKIHFTYERADGAASRRTVRPLGLFYWGNTWSFAAWCELRRDFRNFRLDRMNGPSLLDTAFKAEKGKTLNDYLDALEGD